MSPYYFGRRLSLGHRMFFFPVWTRTLWMVERKNYAILRKLQENADNFEESSGKSLQFWWKFRKNLQTWGKFRKKLKILRKVQEKHAIMRKIQVKAHNFDESLVIKPYVELIILILFTNLLLMRDIGWIQNLHNNTKSIDIMPIS